MRRPAFLKGSLFLTSAMLLSRGAVVLSSALIARAFGVEAFALFTFVHLTATALSNLAMFGMMNGLPRFCARLDLDPSADALSQALLSAGVVIVGLAIAIGAVLILPADLIGLPDPARKGILAALTCAIGLTNLLTGINNGFERFGHVTISSIVMGLALVGGTLVAIFLDAPEWPLRIYFLATLVAMMVLVPATVRSFAASYRAHGLVLDAANVRAVRSYLGPMSVSTMLTNTGLWLAGRSLIGGAAGASGYAEFALGMQWFGLAQMASNVISRSVMPPLTRNILSGDKEGQRRTLRDAILYSVLAAIAILAVVVLLSPFILHFYGREMAGAREALILFVLAAVMAAPVTILASALIVEGRYKEVFWSTVIWWSILVTASLSSFMSGSAVAMSGLVAVSYSVYLASILFLQARTGRPS